MIPSTQEVHEVLKRLELDTLREEQRMNELTQQQLDEIGAEFEREFGSNAMKRQQILNDRWPEDYDFRWAYVPLEYRAIRADKPVRTYIPSIPTAMTIGFILIGLYWLCK